MADVTYGRLDEVLRSLGFSLHGVVEKNKVYRHEETGALVVFPEFPATKSVLPHHLGMVRGVLQNYGIADPMEFASKLQKAS